MALFFLFGGEACRIRAIPDDLEALTQLERLRLGYNRISGFRGNIYLISSLKTLDLGHNRRDAIETIVFWITESLLVSVPVCKVVVDAMIYLYCFVYHS